jgi:hypothetical protein
VRDQFAALAENEITPEESGNPFGEYKQFRRKKTLSAYLDGRLGFSAKLQNEKEKIRWESKWLKIQ